MIYVSEAVIVIKAKRIPEPGKSQAQWLQFRSGENSVASTNIPGCNQSGISEGSNLPVQYSPVRRITAGRAAEYHLEILPGTDRVGYLQTGARDNKNIGVSRA